MDFWLHLFDTSGFPPRWFCGRWSAGHGWLHILSDLGIWSAYFTIPCLLWFFASKKKDLEFRRIFLLFGSFILLCGTTHLMEAVIFWWPAYRLAGAIKLITAIVSWSTVFALVQVVPMALTMRTHRELEQEITARRAAEKALSDMNIELERRIEERTKQLADADRRKDEFLATLAHELRNPLAPIRTGLELMKLDMIDSGTRDQVHGTIDRQLKQLIVLVDDLLDVSRITRGRLELHMQAVDINDILTTAVEASKHLIEGAHHTLHVQLVTDKHPAILADPHRLAQVVANLLNNAAKYTPDGGTIWLEVEQSEDYVTIRVRDTGIGIPQDQMDAIFEMFTQVPRSMNKPNSGLGIGLTLVKRLVIMHGGSITATSAGFDRGSEFTIHLPVHRVPTSMVEPKTDQFSRKDSSVAKRVPEQQLRVLVVDDNREAAELLAITLQIEGHLVWVAYDGEQAVHVAQSVRPNLVFMDIGMPKMNGFEAAGRIRSTDWGKRVVLAALTGWGQESDREKSRVASFNYHLVKPMSAEQLSEVLHGTASQLKPLDLANPG